MDTIFPREASPTWRAIEHGLDLLKKGIIWRVRSGTKIQIWRDLWILWAPSLRPSLRRGGTRVRWVSQLMRPGRREWDEKVVHTCFFPHDADAILRIRLWGRDEEDFIAWNYERSGLFSVRSAYKLALELDQANIRHDSCSSVPDGSRSLYKEIWSANVPPKVRLFAWKVTQ